MSENKVAVVITGVDQFSSAFSNFESRIGSMRDSLLRFGEAAGLAAGAEFVNKISEGVEQMGRLSQKTGVAIGDLSALAFAAQMDDVSIESMSKSIEKLSKALLGADISAKGQSAAKAIEMLGISVHDSEGKLRPLTEILGDIADKFKNQIPAAQRAGVAMTIFGKAGADMIPMLMEGRDGLKELEEKASSLGKTLGEEDVEQAVQFQESLKLLKAATEGLEIQFVGGLLPALNAAIEAFTGVDGGMSGARTAGAALGEVIKTIALTFTDLAYSVDLAVIKAEKWAKIAANPFQAGVNFGAGLRGMKTDAEDSDAQVAALDSQFTKLWAKITTPSEGKTSLAGLGKDAEGVIDLTKSAEQAQKQFEQLAATLMALQNHTQSMVDAGMTPAEKALAAVRVQLEAINQFKLQNPDKIFPILNTEQRALLAEEAKLQSNLNMELSRWKETVEGLKGVLTEGLSVSAPPPQPAVVDPTMKASADLQRILSDQTYANEKIQETWDNTRTAAERYKDALQSLNALHVKGLDDETYQRALKQLKDQFDGAHVSMEQFAYSIEHGGEQGLTRFFTDIVTGSKGARAAFADFAKSIIYEIDKMIAKMIAMWALEKILGWIAGAAAGGKVTGSDAGTMNAPDFGGGGAPIFAADGAHFDAGQVGVVGDGGEPEMWIPDTAGTVVPFSKMKPAGDGGGMLQVRLDITSDTEMKIARATAAMRDQAIQTSVALVRERSLRTIGG